MAQSIVSGLFGLDPTQILQQRQMEQERAALAQAQLSPIESAQYGMIRAGQQLGNIAAPLLGIEDPQLKKAMLAKNLASQFDLSSLQGLQQYAQALAENGAPDLAQIAMDRVRQLQMSQTEMGLKQAQAVKALGPQSDVGRMIAERDALIAQYGPDDPRVREISRAISKEGYIKGQGTGGGEGFSPMVTPTGAAVRPGSTSPTGAPYVAGTDKLGRVKLSDGRVIPAKQFYDAQEDISGVRDLKDMLNALTPDIVNKAYGAAANYTVIPFGGRIAPDTATAQTQVNALRIQETLKTLGPLKGSTSDKEFTEIMSAFPKFTSSPQVMNDWIVRAKKYADKRLSRQEKLFGAVPGEETVPTPTTTTGKKTVKFSELPTR